MAKFILSAFADEAAGSLEKQLQVLAEENIPLLELRGVNGKNCADLTPEDTRAIRAQLEAAGVGLSALGSPFGKIGIDKPFEEHFARFLRGLDICQELGCGRIRMFSFYTPGDADPAAWRDETLRRLDMMLTAAEKAGVLLVHENEKGIYGDVTDRCDDLLRHFGSRMGCAFDPANFIQCGVQPLEAYGMLGERITYMHIKDALMDDGAVVCAGHGDGHVKEILAALNRDRSGEVVLTLEPHLTVFDGLKQLQSEQLTHHESYPDARTAFHAATGALKGILKEIKEEEVC